MTRMSPATPPYPEAVQTQLDRLMPQGVEPLWLFRVLARDERLFARSIGAGLLDRGHLTLRERELVILRTCANNASEYEWGVHVALFGARVGLSREQIYATVHGPVDASCWSRDEQTLVRLCDELTQGTTVSDELWRELASSRSEAALLELLLLASFYRTISVLTNSLEMPLEPFGARFPAIETQPA